MKAFTYKNAEIDIIQPALIINVASFCSLTYCEYTELYKLCNNNTDLNVYAFPCNQFLNQELNNAPDVYKWVKTNFGKLPKNLHIMEMANVNILDNKKIHPIYEYLLNNTRILGIKNPIKWNFEKWLLINNKIQRFLPTVKPLELQKYLV